ncbi:MAG: Eco57I restriction-modification methylase domain-containing protein [Anaerolineales bacterium]|nr:Eco57I restriction-modification methylase domain-containing protein [Anaerolineales bacterium]
MSAPDTIKNLVERFERNYDQYRSSKYNETQLRREFLDPFFEALGWDVFNKRGYAENYKEVIHEDSIEVEGATKAPDYAFRVGGQRKFFVEAKKPSVKIETDYYPAFQLRRYSWSAKLPLGILSDFEEFAVYDCRVKPNKKDKASVGRVMLLSYKDYVEKWDEIVSIFSRDAVLKGSFDSYAEGMKSKKGTTEVDDAFLSEIERWRDLLAKNIALRNKGLNVHELNYAVQMTIDRIVFLRICEDRGVERDEQLKEIASGNDIYKGLVQLFQKADARYNSGLFHFKDEKENNSPADSLTLGLSVDDKVLRDILQNLYYPESPYVFREIPSDILGQVYERFLGKVIRLTASHQAKVEEKPEVRKAGGVYYTPTYIVNYIVQNTVGKLVEGKTPKEVARLRVLDPACGSGTFPLGAYQFLMDWHLDWYIHNNPEKLATGKNPPIFQAKDGWQLTTSKKKEILLNNIYGVDIDAQAVEVTKLSLLLKVLEGESQETIGSQLALLQERVLPDLSRNIQCGNSLIGQDYYEGRQYTMSFADDEERYRVNAFDWKGAFPHVFIQGGFDAVIGNPPYIRIQTLAPEDISYLSKSYETTIGNYDIYCPFLEKAVILISPNGFVSFILPHRFFKTDYGDGLRAFLSSKKIVNQIVDFDGYMVFKDASINTCVIVLSNAKAMDYKFTQVQFTRKPESEMPEIMRLIAEDLPSQNFISGRLSKDSLSSEPWIFVFPWEKSLWEKTSKNEMTLGKISTQIFQGLKTGGDSIFSVHVIETKDKYSIIKSDVDDEEYKIENHILYPQVKGGEMKRYFVGETNRAVIFPYSDGKLIDSKTMEKSYPLAWKYFITHQGLLEARESGKMKGVNWYGYTRSQALSSMQQPKILTPDYYAHPSFCIDTDGDYFFFGGGAGGYGIVIKEILNPIYILGLLNSKLLGWYLSKISVRQYQTAFSYVKKYIEQLPICSIDFTNPSEKAQHDKMVSLVERMLALHKQNSRTPQEQEMVKREIESTDRAIDTLVYELYGLTEEEIKIVEGE